MCACAHTSGVGLYYGEDIYGVPPVLLQFVSRTPVLYEARPHTAPACCCSIDVRACQCSTKL